MAKLYANGTEVCRLIRSFKSQPTNGDSWVRVVSVRSNGVVLKATRITSKNGRFKTSTWKVLLTRKATRDMGLLTPENTRDYLIAKSFILDTP